LSVSFPIRLSKSNSPCPYGQSWSFHILKHQKQNTQIDRNFSVTKSVDYSSVSGYILNKGIPINASDTDDFFVGLFCLIDGINDCLSIIATNIGVNDNILTVLLKLLDLLFSDVHLI
jgi:hypothetical protein